MLRLAALAVALLAACGGRYPDSTTPAKVPDAQPLPKGGIAAAALPYAIVDARTGRAVDEATFWSSVGAATAVCIGEEHPNPHHHWAQLHIVQKLAPAGGAGFALGLEMIQRPFQGVVDDYVAKRIDVAAFQSRVGWEDRWGYDFALYGPTIDAAIAAGGTVLALNASRELTKKVVRQGLEALTAEERAQVPELILDDTTHRAWFDGIMGDMGGHGHGNNAKDGDPAPANPHAGGGPDMPSAERVYTVQVMWDETMAETSAKWVMQHPGGRVAILAGNGHCHDSAIVNRIKRRGIPSVISVSPVIDVEGNVAEALAKPMNDFLFVMQLPKR
jgi:uncharacterized iron-regulated protein